MPTKSSFRSTPRKSNPFAHLVGTSFGLLGACAFGGAGWRCCPFSGHKFSGVLAWSLRFWSLPVWGFPACCFLMLGPSLLRSSNSPLIEPTFYVSMFYCNLSILYYDLSIVLLGMDLVLPGIHFVLLANDSCITRSSTAVILYYRVLT